MTNSRLSRHPIGRIAACLILASLANGPASAQTPDQPGMAPPDAPPAGAPPAGGPPRPPMRERFEAANTTHDGRLTLAQAQAADMPMLVRNFDAIDTGHQGYVTLPQIRSYMQARRAQRQNETPQP